MCVSVYGYVEISEHGLKGQKRRSGHETIALSISPDPGFPLKGRDNSYLLRATIRGKSQDSFF